MGSEGTTLTGGSIRVQRDPSQVSVRRGKFYSLTVTSQSKICPDVQKPGKDPPVNVVPSDPTVHEVWY